MDLLQDRILAKQSTDRHIFEDMRAKIRCTLTNNERMVFDSMCKAIRQKIRRHHAIIRDYCKKNKSLWHQEVFSTKLKNFKYLFGKFWDHYYELTNRPCTCRKIPESADQVLPDLSKIMDVSSVLRTMLS